MLTAIHRLTIQGFKSFRRRVVIPFYPGFTTVVGENGTGKSNIFDAITFVIGRRSRALRAERVEQLLHAPPRGKPVAEAEVSITLGNLGGVFDALLSAPASEVVICRRITPTSSTYRLQGRTCSARDIEQLLSLANIDPNGYYIVEQGMVAEVLDGSPRRRREILDEVAGIAAYEERKAQAILELAQVKERLNTSRILLAERRRRLAELHREREAALEHRALSNERDKLSATLRWRRWEALREREERARAAAERIQEQVDSLTEEIDRLDREIEDREQKLGNEPTSHTSELVRRVERLRGELSAKEAEAHALEREIASLRETIAELSRLSLRSDRPPEAVAKLCALGWQGVLGTIGELVRPKQGMALALEAAMGGHRHDLVVESRDLALRCIRFLKEQKIGRARFLPLDSLRPPNVSPRAKAAQKLAGVLGFALELVEFDQKILPAVAYVLSDTLVAESLEAVRTLDDVRVVTLDGDILERGGAIMGGFPRVQNGPDLGPRRARLRQASDDLDRLRREMEKLSGELTLAEAELHDHIQAQVVARTNREREELPALRDRRREAYRELERKRALLSHAQRELGALSGELAALGEVPEPPGGPEPGSMEVLAARLRDCERRLSELGAVNLRAIEEYDVFLSEFQLWKERVQTLEREKAEIERFIGEIEQKKRDKFLATLAAVSQEFGRIYERLFGGGKAELSLEKEGDITSGLLIHVRLPNKEPRLLDALSGGEKTLVSIAFSLALGAGRPAPFYLLDEVDAALDRANSERLARLMRDLANDAQVIIISHNEEVIRHADWVYGVTMRDGATEVVGMELVHAGKG